MDGEIESPTDLEQQNPFQYSLAALLVVMTVFAIACSLLMAAPETVRLITVGVLQILVPAMLTIAAIYRGGYVRTFCIGALFPAGSGLLHIGSTYSTLLIFYRQFGASTGDLGYGPTIYIVVMCGLSLVVGLLAVAVRRLVEPPSKHPPAKRPRSTAAVAHAMAELDEPEAADRFDNSRST